MHSHSGVIRQALSRWVPCVCPPHTSPGTGKAAFCLLYTLQWRKLAPRGKERVRGCTTSLWGSLCSSPGVLSNSNPERPRMGSFSKGPGPGSTEPPGAYVMARSDHELCNYIHGSVHPPPAPGLGSCSFYFSRSTSPKRQEVV